MLLDALPAGARLGEHTVVSRLGQGGMGVVYEVRDARLGRRVAIKSRRSSCSRTEGPRALRA